jgi:2-polyprenyl-3-methyl-5-hydroxy-6-metoxy-1,4-benzoquinol methylase
MNYQISNAINAEKTKHILASEGRLKEMKKIYKDGNEIENKNSGTMWDKLNLTTHINPKEYPMAWDRTKIVSKWIEKLKVKSVLNIGPGPGNLEYAVLKRNTGYDWTGVDISKKSILILKKQFSNGLFFVSDILNLNTNVKKYDVIVALEVLEHISPKNIFKVLSTIHSMVKKGGHFICSVPINEGLEKMLQNNINPNGHVRIYTKDVLVNELRISRFKVSNSTELYAFHNLYLIKSIVSKIFKVKKPNNLIILSQKL